jgi:hypothetical protein
MPRADHHHNGPNSPTNPRQIAAREKRQQALSYRRAGMNFTDIARLVGYSDRRNAQKAVTRELADAPAEDVSVVRKMEVDRLDALLLSMWKKAMNGDGWSVDRVLRIMERRSRLLGLDEPMKQQIEVITETVLVQEIARMTAALVEREAEGAPEGDRPAS